MHVVEDFDISSHVCGTGATVVVEGELDSASAPRLANEIRSLVSESAVHVTVDLEGTTFVDLSGLRALIAALSAVRRHGGDIVLQAPPRSLQKVLEFTGANDLFVVK